MRGTHRETHIGDEELRCRSKEASRQLVTKQFRRALDQATNSLQRSGLLSWLKAMA